MHIPSALRLGKVAEADFPTRFGHFRIYGFEGLADERVEEAVVLRMGEVAAGPPPLLIYERQEGRGIGLMNKLRAYELQDHGADTIEANERLGFESDLRDYELPGEILRYFGLQSIRLLSNNPEKVRAMQAAGIRVDERVPCIAPALASTDSYLRTKKEKMGHLLEGF
jgi:GTP cyclohydrolase II